MRRCQDQALLYLLFIQAASETKNHKKDSILIKKRKMWRAAGDFLFGGPFFLLPLEKKDMRQTGGWMAMLETVFCMAVASCGIVELGKVEKDVENGVWNGPPVELPSSATSITYVSALDYPEGYDWNQDEEKGSVKCSLVVFAGELPVLKVPVGDEYKVSPDPDMHRISDGHLYTDYSTEAETFFKKDGKPLFSYPGPEMITAFEEIDGAIHTIGHSRSGAGFSYRVNGEVVLQRPSGYSFERISYEDTTVTIAFSEPIQTAGAVVERYYVYRNGNVSQVAVRDDIKRVWDVTSHNGEICYLASLSGVSMPVIVSETKMTALSMPASQSLVSCRMIVFDTGLGVEGILTDGRNIQVAIWGQDGKLRTFAKGMTLSAMCLSDTDIHCAMNSATSSGQGIIIRGNESIAMPPGFACLSRSAMDFSAGMLSVGLSSVAGGKPALWSDGTMTELNVNGYISGVSSVLVE